MMHAHRRFCVSVAASADDLAHMLTERTWCLCSGFYVQGHESYVFLNDATSDDGAAEFAIILGGLGAKERSQIESITFSWCSFDQALSYIRDALAGKYDGNDFARPVTLRLETPAQHQRCSLCA